MASVLLVHAAATWAMVGLIWFVQLVHYPLFGAVGEPGFARYQARHMRRTTRVVGFLMPVEAVTAGWLVLTPPAAVGRWPAVVGLVLVVGLWLSTVLWQAPLHGRLAGGFDGALHRKLVHSNWVRTAGWTARGGVALAMVAAALG